MPRLHRLIKLAQLKKAGKSLTVREMSHICGVSERTIYRYLNTLSEMDLPEELQTQTARQRPHALDLDDIDLALFTLASNRLARYSIIRRRLKKVRRHITAGRRRLTKRTHSRLFSFGTASAKPDNSTRDAVLEQFYRAWTDSKTIGIRVKGSGPRRRVMIPAGLKIDGDDIVLLMTDPVQRRKEKINLCRIQRLDILTESAK